jgi:pimeloyl-ACP methyl ester carboxylesterase
MTQWSQAVLKSHSAAIEADLHQTYASTPAGLKSKLPGSVTSAVIGGVISDRPNYKTVRQPALALYSDWSHPDQLPPHLPKKVRDQADAYYLDSVRPWQIAEEHRFTEEIKCGKKLEIKDSGHYFFLEKPSETAGYIDSFLTSDTPCTWSR